MIDQLFESLNKEPYLLLRILIGAYTGLLTPLELEITINKLTRTSFSFFRYELE